MLHRVGKVAYTLILPSTSRIHPTFHVSLLKPCPDENIPVVALPEEWGSLDDPKEPFKILKRRSIQRHNRAVTEVLIQWKGEAMEEATWELLYKLKLQFLILMLQLFLEDKEDFKGRDMMHILVITA